MIATAETITNYGLPALQRNTPVSDHGLCRTFRIALLLIGNAAQAETAVGDALCSLDPEDVSDEALFRAAIRYAVQISLTQPGGFRDVNRASPGLPDGLEPVLRLSARWRHCFVLRMLAGLSREECSGVLRMNAWSIDKYAVAAAVELSRHALPTLENIFGFANSRSMAAVEHYTKSRCL